MGFGSFFKKLAPWLSAGVQFVPGAGPVIAATINSIAGANGVTLSAPVDHTLPDTIENAVAAITGNSAALAALKQADQQFALQMQQAGFKQITDLEALANEDRDSARKMQETVKSWIPAILACFSMIACIIVTVLIFTNHLQVMKDPASSALAATVVTWTFRDLAQVFAYYFGSSQGSDQKTQVIADIAKQP